MASKPAVDHQSYKIFKYLPDIWIEQRQAQDIQRCSSTSGPNKYEEGDQLESNTKWTRINCQLQIPKYWKNERLQ